jgi:hypothetical protein
VLINTFERLLPRVAADAIARRLGADEQFIAPDGSARQTQWREVVR